MDEAAHNPESDKIESKPAAKWRALPAIERRIMGVLVEKAKTVPESYPMTVAGLVTGANQKNNRFPVMQLEADQLDEPLERLRGAGAIAVVQGSGRVEKYRHYLYDWLGVDKLEMAVMAELLLRGAQTEGELRQRASRMEPIADLTALRNVLNSLKAKNLIVSLTSAGRGHVVTHNLYEPREMEKLRREYEALAGSAAADGDDEADDDVAAVHAAAKPTHAAGISAEVRDLIDGLRKDVDELKAQLQTIRDEIARSQRSP
jgi:uncharacterized protein YceH (UPF0502 family)